MAKSKTKFFCNECGYESAGWLGRCPGCAQWNTFVEEKITKEVSGALNTGIRNTPVAVPINEVSIDDENRLSTSIDELDRVIGGGVVKGSMILIAGDPGVGKSTLMLMLSGNIAKSHRVLYVSGEESVRQIKMRAKRLNVDASELYLVSETNINSITRLVEEIQPSYLVVD
ncbi:MAG: AAA family ATPase, partial [Clostridiaceae bacterium]|nr:AAA family ATPase [Clostridiaceae bacterium]